MPGEQVQVEELLRAPKLSGDYGDVQTALNDWLGESAQLKYPMQGDLLSPFLIHDLDGDGQQDAAVLYTTAQSSNVCVAILQKGSDGMWQVRQNAEGLADTVDSVGLAQLQPGDASQLVVGYVAAQGDHYLAVKTSTCRTEGLRRSLTSSPVASSCNGMMPPALANTGMRSSARHTSSRRPDALSET